MMNPIASGLIDLRTPVHPRLLAASSRLIFLPAATTQGAGTRQRPHQLNSNSGRRRFMLFLKILFRHLEAKGERSLLLEAKRLVQVVTRQNRAGDARFGRLVDSIEKPLRDMVGEAHWIRAHGYMRYYLIRSNSKKGAATAI